MSSRGAAGCCRRAVRTFKLGGVCIALALAACAGRGSTGVPVHVVRGGETLYQIAWQHRVDQRDLVLWNGLRDPDVLRVGQRLRLVPPRGFVAPPPPAPVAAGERAPVARPVNTDRRAAQPTARDTPAAAVPRTRAPAPAPTPSASVGWGWPTEGRLVARFGAAGGIDSGIGIGGRAGQPVRAAAAGRVVYAGGGLIGYGQLVIIKHDETFLSAYGYNSELLVTQGQEVVRGTTIALMGQGPERTPRLHFEIRRNGVPIDPLLFVQPPR